MAIQRNRKSSPSSSEGDMRRRKRDYLTNLSRQESKKNEGPNYYSERQRSLKVPDLAGREGYGKTCVTKRPNKKLLPSRIGVRVIQLLEGRSNPQKRRGSKGWEESSREAVWGKENSDKKEGTKGDPGRRGGNVNRLKRAPERVRRGRRGGHLTKTSGSGMW